VWIKREDNTLSGGLVYRRDRYSGMDGRRGEVTNLEFQVENDRGTFDTWY
jgi:hypothetical protein